MREMDIEKVGIIGAGHIGSQLARLAVAHGYGVVIANSREPETLADLVKELGPKARAATAIDAAKALQWGFLNELTAPDSLDAAIEHAVAEILRCGPGAVRAQKALLRSWEAPTIERGLKQSIAVFESVYAQAEPAEYMRRFLDRKRPA